MTHRELCEEFANQKGTIYIEVPLGSVWLGQYAIVVKENKLARKGVRREEAKKTIQKERIGTQHADLIVVRPSYTKFCVDIFEVKRARSDLMKDIKDGKWKGYLPHCHRFYFACEKGIAKKADIPDPAGLWVRGDRGWACTKGAEARDTEISMETMMSMIFWRQKATQNLHDRHILSESSRMDIEVGRRDYGYGRKTPWTYRLRKLGRELSKVFAFRRIYKPVIDDMIRYGLERHGKKLDKKRIT